MNENTDTDNTGDKKGGGKEQSQKIKPLVVVSFEESEKKNKIHKYMITP